MESDMSNQNVLQQFSYMLEAHAIPEFSLPTHAIPRIQQISNTFFATAEGAEFLAQSTNLAEMLENYTIIEGRTLLAEENTQDENTVLFLGCGLSGYGLQNWKFYYFLITPKLKLMLSIPYGNVYNDAKMEKETMDYALKLIQVCQQNLLPEEKQTLSLFFSEKEFSYCVTNDAHEKIHEGKEITKLLDLFVVQGNAQKTHADWIKV